jgi:hypothetical protein
MPSKGRSLEFPEEALGMEPRLATPNSGTCPRYLAGIFFLFLIAAAVYQKALWFMPASADDLRILSSVSQTHNPLSYFTKDWGMQNTYRLSDGRIDTKRRTYRPLHAISIWIGYRLFGVSAYPNQLINILLHILNCAILLRILYRLRIEIWVAGLLMVLGLISLYTVSPAIWVSDRQTLVVALTVLVLFDYLIVDNEVLRDSLNMWLVVGLTVVAVLFKESGLIVPLISAAFILIAPGIPAKKIRPLSICALLVVCYLGLRVLLFGPNAFAYASEGFVFLNRPYTLLSDLPWYIGLLARAENILKDFLCVFLPVFSFDGRLDSLRDLFGSIWWWLPAVVLTISATRRPLTRVQWLMLATIAANSLLHVQVFRYRVEYISQFALCIYVGASPIWHEIGQAATYRRRLAVLSAGVLALVGVSQVNHYIQSNLVERQEEMRNGLTTVVRKYPISDSIVQQVLSRYAPITDMKTTRPQ